MRCKRVIFIGLLLLWSVVGNVPPGQAQKRRFDEYQVKAVFLYNLTCFVFWPQAAFSSPDAPFRIVIYGNDPFGPLLDRVMANETVQGRPIMVERVAANAPLPPCQMLFVTAAAQPQAAALTAALSGEAVLTVGETSRFIPAGGMINLQADHNRVQLQINSDAARRAEQGGLILSAKLLRVATLVDSEGDTPP
jgi:hypothetical protein